MAARNKYGINDQQQRFLDRYRQDPELNAGRAYKETYPKCKSMKSAWVNASQLLSSAKCQKYLATKVVEETAGKEDFSATVTINEIIRELTHAAFLDPADLFDESDQLLSFHEIPEQIRRAIGSFKVKRNLPKDGESHELAEIKLSGKEKTLELLGRHMTMFTDKFQMESEEAMYKRVSEKIRSGGEEAISMLIANYRRLEKIRGNGEAIVRPTGSQDKMPEDQPIDLSKLI